MAEEQTTVYDSDSSASDNCDTHYDPIVSLPEMDLKTNEEDEEELVKIRAKLYRCDRSTKPPEWKERGIGDAKLLWNKEKGTVRMVMRRDKTLKICANHFIGSWTNLEPHCGSDRAFLWSTPADFADEVPAEQLLAIRFGTPENADIWRQKFVEAQKLVKEYGEKKSVFGLVPCTDEEEKVIKKDLYKDDDVYYSEDDQDVQKESQDEEEKVKNDTYKDDDIYYSDTDEDEEEESLDGEEKVVQKESLDGEKKDVQKDPLDQAEVIAEKVESLAISGNGNA